MFKYLLVLILLLPFIASADRADGTFIPPTQRADNTPMTQSEIGGYNVYLDGVLHPVSPLPAAATTFSLTLAGGSYQIRLTTIDIDGRESVFSDPPTTVDVPFSPDAPSGLNFIISI